MVREFLNIEYTVSYRRYHLVWSGEGNLAEINLFHAGELVSEWRGEIDAILETFHDLTDIHVAR